MLMFPLLQTCLPCWQVRCRGLCSFPSRGRVPLLSVERDRIARVLPLLQGSCQGPDLGIRMGVTSEGDWEL